MNKNDDLSTLAQKRDDAKRAKAEQKRADWEEKKKTLIPLSALIVANIIFFSLDIRAFQAILLITNSSLLAFLTVLISGGLAMYWFDVLFPHSKRHNNTAQKNISVVFTILAILLSGVLAFADYVVGTGNSFSGVWAFVLWAAIIVLTIAQGTAIAIWWSIDNHIAAEAKIMEAHAEAADQNDEMHILETKLHGLSGVMTTLQKLDDDFSPEAVRKVANLLGIVLPDTVVSKPAQPSQPMRAAFTKTVDSQELDQRDNHRTPEKEKSSF